MDSSSPPESYVSPTPTNRDSLGMFSNIGPSGHAKNQELSTECRHALAVRHAIALPPGKNELPKSVASSLVADLNISDWVSSTPSRAEFERGVTVPWRKCLVAFRWKIRST